MHDVVQAGGAPQSAAEEGERKVAERMAKITGRESKPSEPDLGESATRTVPRAGPDRRRVRRPGGGVPQVHDAPAQVPVRETEPAHRPAGLPRRRRRRPEQSRTQGVHVPQLPHAPRVRAPDATGEEAARAEHRGGGQGQRLDGVQDSNQRDVPRSGAGPNRPSHRGAHRLRRRGCPNPTARVYRS